MYHTIANNTDPLPLSLITPVPSRRVHNLALKAIQTLNLRIPRLIELSDRTDEEVTLNRVRGTEF